MNKTVLLVGCGNMGYALLKGWIDKAIIAKTSVYVVEPTDANLKRAVDLGVHEVGSHTLTHPHLTEISPEQAEREIILSKTMIEDALGETIHSFAYPYGDENDIIRQLVAKAGYKFAVTTQKGRARGSENDYELPRHSIRRNDTILHFLAKCLCR